jgi:hypothetical protein
MKSRIWSEEANEKREQGYCLICGSTDHLELAHITGRIYDRPRTPGSKTVYVEPESVVLICGPFPEGCHGAYDRHELDILSHLYLPEQIRAVEDLGSIESARRRLCPSDFQTTEGIATAAPDRSSE